MNQYREYVDLCKKITRQYGTSYFLSTYFFPKTIREKTWILYAFVRYPDEIVDTQEKDTKEAYKKLSEWKKSWEKVYAGENEGVHPILEANALLWKESSIPFEYSSLFLDAMFRDTDKNRYSTYEELESYMYGSATVVGYMMSYIIGFKEGALPYAKALGEAFQLTNFLRDIKEDLERGRIYIPKEDMEQCGVNEEDFRLPQVNTQMKKLIEFEIKRTETLYEKALPGISLLGKKGQRAVRIAFYLYREILLTIKKRPEIIFEKRVRIPKWKKIIIILKNF